MAIFDGPTPTVIFGSDVLRLTPDEVLAHTYCLDEELLEKTAAALCPLPGLPSTETYFSGL